MLTTCIISGLIKVACRRGRFSQGYVVRIFDPRASVRESDLGSASPKRTRLVRKIYAQLTQISSAITT